MPTPQKRTAKTTSAKEQPGAEPIEPRLPTGVAGLDAVLQGGLIPAQAYLLRGGPGTGKTTLGLHFLTQALASSSKAETAEASVLFITLGEVETKLRRNAAKLGFDLAQVHFLDLSPDADFFIEDRSYDIFAPADVERGSVTQQIIARVQSLKPDRVFVDSITQFRYLSSDSYQFHQQVLSFIRYLTDAGATTIFTSDSSDYVRDDDLMFLSDGVISLKATADGRSVEVEKFRGSGFVEGQHSMKLSSSGLQVFPQLKPDTFGRAFSVERISSGVLAIDQLLHGGIEGGTVTIVSGPTGVGKTSLCTQFMKAAAARGERSVLYSFEEAAEMILHRCEGISIPARAMVENGTLVIESIEAMSMSPDEFAQQVRYEVEVQGAQIVMIDGLAGYRQSMWGTQANTHIHALCRYLRNMGVTTLLIDEVGTVTGEFQATGQPLSYLADTIIFLRYLEIRGELRRAIGVLKKRLSSFETTLREFEVTGEGLKVGEPLSNLRGILKGIPEWATPPPDSMTDD